MAGGSSIVNGAVLTASMTAYQAIFNGRMAEETADHVADYVMERDSKTAIEKWHFMEPTSAMSLFDGEREFEQLVGQAFSVENKVYSKGIEIDIDDVTDDRIGIVTPAIQGLADSALQLWNKLMAAKLDVGEAATSLGYDGVPFFGATHPTEAGGTQLNFRANALNAANFAVGILDMETLTNSKGDPIDVFATVLMVPPALRATGEGLVESANLVGGAGAPNPNFERTKLVVNRYLTSATAWYLFDLSHTQKPFVRQKHTKASLVMSTDPTQESIKKHRKVEPYSELRGALDYALWQFVYKGKP